MASNITFAFLDNTEGNNFLNSHLGVSPLVFTRLCDTWIINGFRQITYRSIARNSNNSMTSHFWQMKVHSWRIFPVLQNSYNNTDLSLWKSVRWVFFRISILHLFSNNLRFKLRHIRHDQSFRKSEGRHGIFCERKWF